MKRRGWFRGSRREEIIEKQYYEIKQLENRYKKLYDESPIMLRTISRDGIILDCNLAYASNLGYATKEEVIGLSIFDHTPDDVMKEKMESFEVWQQTGLVKNNESWLKRKNGTKFPVLINANNLYDESGNFVGSNTAITDMTEIMEARRLQQKATMELQKAIEIKEEFLNLAAHELRTPIQPVLGYTELAEKGLVKPEVALRKIRESAIRLRDLADDILAVAKIGSGSFKYDMQSVEIEPLIDRIVDNAKLAIQNAGKDNKVVMVRTSKANITTISLDKSRMLQALENILQNAIKFTEKGQITIETCLLDKKELYEIKIKDSGPGIPADILPRLFDKFVTRHPTDKLNQKGTGLGLFITKAIIQAHGGEIFGFNNADCGATFVIRLPISGNKRKLSTSASVSQ